MAFRNAFTQHMLGNPNTQGWGEFGGTNQQSQEVVYGPGASEQGLWSIGWRIENGQMVPIPGQVTDYGFIPDDPAYDVTGPDGFTPRWYMQNPPTPSQPALPGNPGGGTGTPGGGIPGGGTLPPAAPAPPALGLPGGGTAPPASGLPGGAPAPGSPASEDFIAQDPRAVIADMLSGQQVSPLYRNFLMDQGGRYEAIMTAMNALGQQTPSVYDFISGLFGQATSPGDGGQLAPQNLRSLVDQLATSGNDGVTGTFLGSDLFDDPSEAMSLVMSILQPTMSSPFIRAMMDRSTRDNLDADYRVQSARGQTSDHSVGFLRALGII